MSLVLHTSPVLAPLDNPEMSGAKRLRQWFADKTPEPSVLPGLDVAALQRKYHPDRGRAPRMLEGTFRVELGMRMDTFNRIRDDRVNRFVIEMNRRGWDLDLSQNIQVYPGIHPAIDLTTGKPMIGLREFVVRAWFKFRNPEVQRLELDPAWLKPIEAAG